MTLSFRRAVSLVFASVLLLAITTLGNAAILFKGKQPIKIGIGTVANGVIKWTDCKREHPETFQDPPYSLDLTDNCSVGPPIFGLNCEEEACTVVDAPKLEKYLPGLHNGDKVRLRIQASSVSLTSGSHVLTIDR